MKEKLCPKNRSLWWMMKNILELVRFNLSKEGYHVICATTGERAVEMARSELPDLIVLDLMLPGMDGLEVAKFLKNEPETKKYPDCDIIAAAKRIEVELSCPENLFAPSLRKVLPR